ncbi:hypothetical protein NC651_007592 [Populus alba x Populus x berolinensis]|nr:hypothetical protein NC651_007592 [Populus alba x Populus x berolinensis]
MRSSAVGVPVGVGAGKFAPFQFLGPPRMIYLSPPRYLTCSLGLAGCSVGRGISRDQNMCLKEAIAKEICLERNMHFASDRPTSGPSKSINASIQRFLSAQTQLAHFVEQVCYKLLVLEEEKRLLAENLRA